MKTSNVPSRTLFLGLVFASWTAASAAGQGAESLAILPAELTLRGPQARHRLLAEARLSLFLSYLAKFSAQFFTARLLRPTVLFLVTCATINDHAGADRDVGQTVDEDQRAGRFILLVAVERNGLI